MTPTSSFNLDDGSMLSAGGALAIALCLTASWLILRHAAPIADKLGLIDRPNEARKIHARPTPRMGGLAFFATLLISAGLSAFDHAPDRLLVWGAGLVGFHFVMGAIDDRRGLSASLRLVLSIAAVGLTLACNDELIIHTIRLGATFGVEIPRLAALVLTTLGIVFFIFSVNFMDGRNGILGVNALWWLALLQAMTNILPIWAFLAAAVTLLAFLRFNLRGLLFAGDGGAYVVGSGIAMLALAAYARRPDTMAFDQLMVLFLLPVLDAARVLLRRLWLRMRPFQPDNSHLHHVLWRRAGDRGAARLYTAAIIVPSTLAALLPTLALPILGAAIGFFFMLVYWPTEPLAQTTRAWRYVRPMLARHNAVSAEA